MGTSAIRLESDAELRALGTGYISDIGNDLTRITKDGQDYYVESLPDSTWTVGEYDFNSISYFGDLTVARSARRIAVDLQGRHPAIRMTPGELSLFRAEKRKAGKEALRALDDGKDIAEAGLYFGRDGRLATVLFDELVLAYLDGAGSKSIAVVRDVLRENLRAEPAPFDSVLLSEFLEGQAVWFDKADGSRWTGRCLAEEDHFRLLTQELDQPMVTQHLARWQAETWFFNIQDAAKAISRETVAEVEAGLAAIGVVEDYAVLRHVNHARWAAVVPGRLEGGSWRLQRFDNDGFSGTSVYFNKGDALDGAVREGYTQRDDAALDILLNSPRLQQDHELLAVIRQTEAQRASNTTEANERLATDLLGDPVAPIYPAATLRHAGRVIEILEQVMSGQTVDMHRLDELLEAGDGADVSALIVAKIADDAVFARGILSEQCARVVTPTWIGIAEQRLGHVHAVEVAVADLGLQIREVSRDTGAVHGTVLAMTDRFLVQGIGKGQCVVHRKNAFVGEVPSVSDKVSIRYRGGNATTAHHDRDVLPLALAYR